jgi:uncharacterized protein YajQ (UPF0234 family)
MREKYHNLTLINVHAPTEDKDIRVTEQFYDDLQSVYENIAKHDTVLILGNLNWQRTSVFSGIRKAHFA